MPPQAQIGPITDAERKAIIQSSLLAGHYEQVIDRESAYEKLKGRAEQKQINESSGRGNPTSPISANGGGMLGGMLGGVLGGGNSRRQGVGEALVKSVVRTVGAELGRQLVRGVMGSLLGGSSGRRR